MMNARRVSSWLIIGLLGAILILGAGAEEHDGFLTKDGRKLFPLGFYELPESEEGLKAMADAGVNLVRCRSRADLDRLHALGMQGVMPLPFQKGATDDLRAKVAGLVDHPALAVWEGPDEVVWNFTAYSGLYRTKGVHETRGAWWSQAPEAKAYAAKQAATVIPNMREAVAMIRDLDEADRPVWINEAKRSDVYYVRQYLGYADITGCDYYPVSARGRDVAAIAGATERWNQVGRGMPVFMVLQAFSWHELGGRHEGKGVAYPTFEESRFMAYDAIAHGAEGILYWGSHYLQSDPCRQALYAVTSELAALQPFLTAPEAPGTRLEVVEAPEPGKTPHVASLARNVNDDWLVVLVNEDDERHMGVVVEGLDALNGKTMYRLYTDDETVVSNSELIARMQPKDVQVFATSRNWETDRRVGRDFGAEPEQETEDENR